MIPRQQAVRKPRAAIQAEIGVAAEQRLIVERRRVGAAAQIARIAGMPRASR